MIKNLLIVCLLSTIAVHVHTKSQYFGQKCRTPVNQNGTCIRYRYCTSLHTKTRDYVRQSLCGGDFVCCPASVAAPSPIPRTYTTTRRTITTTTPTPILQQRSSIPRTSTTTRRTITITPTGAINRISARKCKDYEDFAYNKSYTVSVLGPDIEHRTSNCAFTSTGLVYRGEVAKLREFPHMALIGFISNNEIVWLCGGTLISERFVLSAEHCSSNKGIVPHVPAKYVRLGEHNINQADEAFHIDFDIIQIISRPNVSPRTYNDIVLFKLDRVVPFSHAIRPACLPQQSDVPRVVTATGWGNVEGGDRSDALLKVDLTTFSRDEWNRTKIAAHVKDFDEDTIVFAGHHSERKDTCQGDSGGPLQIIDRNHHCTYIVVGVTSTGIGCGVKGRPAIYTKVYSHLDWIEQTVWPNQ